MFRFGQAQLHVLVVPPHVFLRLVDSDHIRLTAHSRMILATFALEHWCRDIQLVHVACFESRVRLFGFIPRVVLQ